MKFGNKIGEEIVYTDGSFTRKTLWFSGLDQKLAQEYIKKRATVKFILGRSGQETKVTVDEIKPIKIFDT